MVVFLVAPQFSQVYVLTPVFAAVGCTVIFSAVPDMLKLVDHSTFFNQTSAIITENISCVAF